MGNKARNNKHWETEMREKAQNALQRRGDAGTRFGKCEFTEKIIANR